MRRSSSIRQGRLARHARWRLPGLELLEARLTPTAELEPNHLFANATAFLASSDTLIGQISTQADVDHFVVSLNQGETLSVQLGQYTSWFNTAPSGEILDAAGRVMAHSFDGHPMLMQAPTAGMYYLRLSSPQAFQPFVGSYSITTSVTAYQGAAESESNDTAATADPLGSALLFRGTLSSAADVDFYSFAGSAGNLLTIKFADRLAGNPAVRLYDPSGNLVVTDTSGLGIQQKLTVSGTYKFSIHSDNAAGTVTGGYVGSMIRLTSAAGESEPADDPVGAPSWVVSTTASMATGSLSSLGDIDYFAVDLQPTNLYLFYLYSPTGNLLAQNRRLSLFNEHGQLVAYSLNNRSLVAGDAQVPEGIGRYYLAVQALDETGLGGYSVYGWISGTFPTQRDVPLFFHDFTGQTTHLGYGPAPAFTRPDVIPVIEGNFESRYDPYDVDLTLTDPGAGVERIDLGVGDNPLPGCYGLGGGNWGSRRPSGSAVLDEAGQAWWTRYADFDFAMAVVDHEQAHAVGLPHFFNHPLSNVGHATVDQHVVGSLFEFESVSGTQVLNPRNYLDWVLQAGRITLEAESNDVPAAAMDLDPFFAEMRADGTPRNDRVVVAGRIDAVADVDVYGFTATAGQTFALDIDAAEFQYPLDASLTLLDSAGNTLAVGFEALDRESGLQSVDPYVVYTFAASGTYHVRVAGQHGTVGNYRLKLTPAEAFDTAGPRVIAALPDGGTSRISTRQLVFWFNDQLDPATLTAENILIQGTTSGIRPGTAYFDPMESALIWRADTSLPVDSYTVTFRSGAAGIKDLRGNPLDGETDGVMTLPEVSGNGTPGGDFTTTFTITGSSGAATANSVQVTDNGWPNRGSFHLNFSTNIDLVSATSGGLTIRGAGSDEQFETADDTFLPVDTYLDKTNSSTVEVFVRGFADRSTQYRAGGAPQAAVAGDFSGDGNPDVLAVNWNGSLSLVAGNGDGTFQSDSIVVAGTNNGCRALATGDFNGDGKLDVVTPNMNTETLSVRLGNGDGSFQNPVSYPVGTDPLAVLVADVNLDSFLDVVVGNQTSNDLSVLLGNGDGTLQASAAYSLGAGEQPASVEGFGLGVADFSGDGVPDLAAANYLDHRLLWLPGIGGGTFGTAQLISTLSSGPVALTTGDFNQDGKADLAVAEYYSFSGHNVSVFLGNGNGTFQSPVNLLVGNLPQSITAGDFNADHALDLAVVSTGATQMSVLLGNGNGTFQSPQTYSTGTTPHTVTTADFNNDGGLDLLVTNVGSNSVNVFVGNGNGSFQSPRYRVEGTLLDAAGNLVPVQAELALKTADRSTYVAEMSVQPNTVIDTPVPDLAVTFSGDINPATLTPSSFKVTFSADPTFFDGNDQAVSDADGVILWDARYRRAVFQPAVPLTAGYYRIELDGDAGGIRDTAGRLLDGEYMDSNIQGNEQVWFWKDAPSGDSLQGGDYVAVFQVADLGEVRGTCYYDLNDSGTREAGEPGLAGHTIFLDLNQNGTFDPWESSTTTDTTGTYRFRRLDPGTYTVRMVRLAGWQPTGPAGGEWTVPVAAGQTVTGKDFGSYRPMSIRGVVFQDSNGNGSQDVAELGLAGRTVFLDTNGNNQLDAGESSTPTDANGNYAFTDLTPAAYRVRQVVPPLWKQTTVDPADLLPSAGPDHAGIRFGTLPPIGPDGFGHVAVSTTYEAIDLIPGGIGVFGIRDGQDDGVASVNLGSNTFTYYGTVYSGTNQLHVSTNGLITFGTSNNAWQNADLTASPSQRAIAVLWDDWTTAKDTNDQVLGKLDDLNNDGTPDRLIIEWNQVWHVSGGTSPVTFQAVLQLNTGPLAGGTIIANFPDLDTGSASLSNGLSATVGLKDTGTQGNNRLLVSNTAAHPLVGSGKAIRFLPPENDPPVNGVPGAQTVAEDQSLVFRSANGNGLTVADLDAGSGTVRVTLTATHGVLTLSSTAGLGFTAGDGTADPALTFTGTLTAINQALDGLRFLPAADYVGPAAIQITTDDLGNTGTGGTRSDTDTVSVTVSAVNDPPSFTRSSDQTVLEDALPQSVAGWATAISAGPPDEAGQALTFVVSNDNPALFSEQPAIDASGTLTYTPAANVHGIATVTVRLTDDGGVANSGADTSVPRTFTITVTTVNDAPSFTKGANQTVLEDAGPQNVESWATAISAGPPDEAGQAVTFVVSSSNPFLFSTQPAIDAGGKLTYTLAPNASGTATVTVRLTDDGGLSSGGIDTSVPQTFTITLTAINDAPTFARGSDLTALEGTGPQGVAGWATAISAGPPDETDQTLTFVVSNDNPALFSEQPAIDASGRLTYVPAADVSGTATVTVRLVDSGDTANGGANASGDLTFIITITAVNDAPVRVAGILTPIRVAEDSSNTTAVPLGLDAIAYGPGGGGDEAGQTLSYRIITVPSFVEVYLGGGSTQVVAGTALSLAELRSLEYRTIAQVSGAGSLTWRVRDDGGIANGGQTDLIESLDLIVSAENDTPVLTPVGPTLTPIPRNTANPAGDTVAAFLGTSVSDVDAGAVEGVAVIGLTGSAGGAWQFSPDDGAHWTSFGPVIPTAPHLLRGTDRVRFLPNPGFTGTPTLTYHAWDGSTLSVAADTARLRVATTLPAITEDSRTPASSAVGSLVSAFIQDDDPGALKGMAVVGLTGTATGTWQYSLNGGLTWLPLADVSPARARLLRDTAKVRYLPAANWFGQATLEYRGWDQTAGVAGGVLDLRGPVGTGGATAVSAATDLVFAVVSGVNDRPVLDPGGQPWLTEVLPGTTEPAGDVVADLLSGSVTDPDPGAAQGIAVVAAPAVFGRWEYQLPGQRWEPMGTVSGASALLLGPQDRVRFVPQAGLGGVAQLTYRAWDQTTAQKAGSRMPVGAADTAFSLASETPSVLVAAVLQAANRAPTLDPLVVPTLTTITEDAAPTRGDLVGQLLTLGYGDADVAALRGVAITGLGGAAGTWQYSLNGGSTWVALTTVSPANALLLRDSDRLRFVPGRNVHGTAELAFRAWDRTRGTAGARANVLAMGGAGGVAAFSTGEETARLIVLQLNDRPVLDTSGSPRLTPLLPNTSEPAGDLVGTLLGTAVVDVDAEAARGMAVTAAVSTVTTGEWEYQLAGREWQRVGAVSSLAALLLGPEDRLRFVPKPGFTGVVTVGYRAWDQTVSPGPDHKAAITATSTAFSTATETASVTVNAVNDRPILDIRGTPALPSLLPGSDGATGARVASLLGGWVSDPDAGAAVGMAVTAASVSGGRWQYSTDDGQTWHWVDEQGSLTARAAVLLRGQDRLRFVPATGFRGRASLTYRAWDQSDGRAAGTRADPTLATATAFSLATETLLVVVNTAPEVTP